MTYALASINPFYAARLQRAAPIRQDRSRPTSRSTPACRVPRSPAARCRT